MKLVRFKLKNTIKYGVLTENSVIEIRGNIYTMFRKTSYEYDLDDIEILCPVKARQIWGPTKNGRSSDGVIETNEEVILDPWLKGSNAICGPNAPVIVENDLFSGVHITLQDITELASKLVNGGPKFLSASGTNLSSDQFGL